MNKLLQYILLATFFFAGCNQFDELSGVPQVEGITVQVKVNLETEADVPAPESYKIKMINYSDKYEVIAQTAPDGTANVPDLLPGVYNITVSAEVSYEGFTYYFTGSSTNANVVVNGKSLEVKAGVSKSGNLLLKEVYYVGSRTSSKGAYFRDQFYEIYNNSNTVQYADSLCLAVLLPSRATALLPVWPGPDADKYVYCESIWQVPGNGTTYPVLPGESIIIAQMAANHQAATWNPNSPVNLLSAEFETLVNTTSLVQDNPAINMKMAFWPKPGAQWLVTVFGGAYALFYPDRKIDPNETVTPEGRTDKAYKVPITQIVDALELVDDETKMKLKRVSTLLDAGAATIGETYTSKSVARKVKDVLPDGRVILQDTNNSSEDFEVKYPAQIRRYGAKVPSWNTWAN